MNHNSTAIAEIQQKYQGCNLLVPTASEAQLNPFYKLTVMEVKADVSEGSGDIFPLGRVKRGENWVDTYSPAKPLLMKLAAAAGIQFDPNNTYGTMLSKNCYKAKAYGAMRMPDGTGKTHCDEKIINLDDEEDRFRLEFMDKSIQGITDPRAAEEAAKLFKGEFFDTTNKFGKTVKGYKIADCDRQKYIDRSVLVNMTLLRKTAAEKAMTGAILRVIRALIGMKGAYTMDELRKPFAVARVTFSPDYSDPAVRNAMLSQGMNSVSNMFGSRPPLAMGAAEPTPIVPEDTFNPDEFADNPAFTSDTPAGVDDGYIAPAPEYTGVPQGETTRVGYEDDGTDEQLVCSQCGREISQKIAEYSKRRYGVALCMKCQKEVE